MDHSRQPESKELKPGLVAIFGALTGLACGLMFKVMDSVAEARRFRAIIREEELQRVLQGTDRVIACSFIEASNTFDPTIQILSTIFFVMLAILMVYVLAQRPRMLLSLWAGLGLLVMFAAYGLGFTPPDPWSVFALIVFGAIAYLGYAMYRRNPSSIISLWVLTGIFFVFIPAAAGVSLTYANLNNRTPVGPLGYLLCLAVTVPISAIFGWLMKVYLQSWSTEAWR